MGAHANRWDTLGPVDRPIPYDVVVIDDDVVDVSRAVCLRGLGTCCRAAGEAYRRGRHRADGHAARKSRTRQRFTDRHIASGIEGQPRDLCRTAAANVAGRYRVLRVENQGMRGIVRSDAVWRHGTGKIDDIGAAASCNRDDGRAADDRAKCSTIVCNILAGDDASEMRVRCYAGELAWIRRGLCSRDLRREHAPIVPAMAAGLVDRQFLAEADVIPVVAARAALDDAEIYELVAAAGQVDSAILLASGTRG